MDAAALGVREPAPDLDAVLERGRAFRVVGDAGHHRAGKEKMGRAGPVDVLGECGHDAGHVLQGIPARHLDDERHVRRRRRARLEHVDVAIDATGRSVLEGEDGRRPGRSPASSPT